MSNYYLALGIERTADLNKIKQAYRICCKKYHPDSGSSKGDKQRFLRIQEAYESLSDEEKRKEYDQRLSKHECGESRQRSGGIHPFAGRSPFKSSPFDRAFGSFTSLLDEFFGGYVPGFFDDPFSTEKELYAELVLSLDETRAGRELPIEIPVIAECPACRDIRRCGSEGFSRGDRRAQRITKRGCHCIGVEQELTPLLFLEL